MKLGPKSEYLCLIPRPPQESPVVEEPATEVATPVHSWSLLQPLSGTCLYVSVRLQYELERRRQSPDYSTAKGGSHTLTVIIPMSVSFTSCTTSTSPAQVTSLSPSALSLNARANCNYINRCSPRRRLLSAGEYKPEEDPEVSESHRVTA